jgi:hypothetical protein
MGVYMTRTGETQMAFHIHSETFEGKEHKVYYDRNQKLFQVTVDGLPFSADSANALNERVRQYLKLKKDADWVPYIRIATYFNYTVEHMAVMDKGIYSKQLIDPNPPTPKFGKVEPLSGGVAELKPIMDMVMDRQPMAVFRSVLYVAHSDETEARLKDFLTMAKQVYSQIDVLRNRGASLSDIVFVEDRTKQLEFLLGREL